MGDVLTLIEKAEEAYDTEEAEKAAEKMLSATFDLEDFLEQFQQLRKMGPLQSLVKMLPGAGQMLRDVEIDDRDRDFLKRDLPRRSLRGFVDEEIVETAQNH